MKNVRLFLLVMLILPWLSIPLLKKKSFKRFVPAAIFVNIVVALESLWAKKQTWWWVFKRIGSGWKGETPFIWGPFIVGSLWILKYTYGHFAKFLMLNTIVDSAFAFVVMAWLKRVGIAALIRMKNYQLLSLFLGNAVLLYGFQMAIERFRSGEKEFK